MTQLKTIRIDNVSLFYRQAGNPNAPALLLLHGFPSSSHQFRNLIPLLAGRFFVIAPDLPAFGFSSAPSPTEFTYTFDHLAEIIAQFTEAIGLTRFATYVFDYGAPIGWRLALRNPERITAIVSQNGNAYEEGLSEGWNPIRQYWADPSQANRDALRGMLTLELTKFQYLQGVADPSAVAPESYLLDQALLDRPGNAEIQLDLFRDYANNVALYPKVQAYFRTAQPPLLAIWGKNDPFFLPAGAEAFRRDNPHATHVLLDTGHFALETHLLPIATHITRFLGAVTAKRALETARSPRQVVESFYRGLLAGDTSTALAQLSPEIQWIGTAGFPYAGVFGTRDEVVAGVLGPMRSDFDPIELQPERFLDSGDEVVALGYYVGTHRNTGKAMRSRFSHTFRVQHGLVTAFDQVSDTHQFRAAMQ